MCGISGLYGLSSLATAHRMTTAITHRGPDAFDVKLVGRHVLGAARLAIEGGAEASQPAVSAGIGIVFNGEIYNYTTIDSATSIATTEIEAIRQLYIKHGTQFPNYLHGMFAVAIVDDIANKVVLARDSFGIKPLYYTVMGGRLAFASEIKALLQIDQINPELDIEALEGLMTFGYVFQQDRTLFKNIHQVLPGHTVTFDGVRLLIEMFYDIPSAYFRGEGTILNSKFCVAAKKVSTFLQEALSTQLAHGQQRKAFYLSGGVDSSFITSLAAAELSYDPVTYTLADDQNSEDLQYARKVAKALGIEHREVTVDLQTYLKFIPDYIHHFEHAIAGGIFDLHGGLAFHILSAEIAKDFKIAFSGEGADELFGGYYWTYTHPRGFADRIKNRRVALGGKGEIEAVVNQLFPSPENEQVYRRNLFDWLVRGGLSNYHLCSVDRSCSAFGFEIRPVYLDHRVADFAFQLPIDYKLGLDGKQTKYVLKEAARPLFKKLGIESVLTRQKLGMPWAVRNLDASIRSWAATRMTDQAFGKHPFRRLLTDKIEGCMFDVFFWIFMINKGVLEDSFDLNDFFVSGRNESMYH